MRFLQGALVLVVPPHTSQFLKMCESIMLSRCHYFGRETGILGSRGLGASVVVASLSAKVLSELLEPFWQIMQDVSPCQVVAPFKKRECAPGLPKLSFAAVSIFLDLSRVESLCHLRECCLMILRGVVTRRRHAVDCQMMFRSRSSFNTIILHFAAAIVASKICTVLATLFSCIPSSYVA